MRRRASGGLPLAALVCGCLLVPRLLTTQEPAEATGAVAPVPLRDFRLSSPPALALLGASAASVTRPNTPRELIASLVSAAGTSGVVPDGFAIETTPYWLVRRRALQLSEYHAAALAARLKYFTSISTATSRPTSRSDAASRDARVAIALRTLLANGRPNSSLVRTAGALDSLQLAYLTRYRRWETAQPVAARLAAARRRLAQQEDLLGSLTTRVLVGPETALRDSTLRTLARRDSARSAVSIAEDAEVDVTRLAKELDALDGRIGGLAKRFAAEDLEPDGFLLELAAGTRMTFTEGNWDRSRSDGIGVWVTPMYRLAAQQLELIGVARYLTSVRELDGGNVLDLGGRLGRDLGRGSISGELVRRTVSRSERLGIPDASGDAAAVRSSSRWAGIFNHPLAGGLQLVASFGSDFRGPTGRRPVIATIGLNLGVGAIMLVPAQGAR